MRDPCICLTRQMPGIFAEITLSEMQRILRGARDDKRRAQNGNDVGLFSNLLEAPGIWNPSRSL